MTSVALAGVALLVVAYWLRIVLLPFVFAGAVAFVATPAVERLSRRARLPRWIAALLIFAVILAGFGAVCFWAFHVLAPQGRELANNAPALLEESFRKLVGKPEVRLFGMDITAQSLRQSAQDAFRQFVGGPAQAVAALIALLTATFLCLLLVLFFLLSGPRLVRGVLWLVPPGYRPIATDLGARVRPILFRYIVGVFVVVLIASILTWIVLALILRLPNAAVVSVTVGLLETIPVVGPAASVTLLIMLGVISGRVEVLIGLAIFAMAIRLFIDQVMAPLILGRAVRLHPAVVIFVMLAGGVLFGILGVVLAVPTAAATKVALQLLYNRNVDTALPLSSGS